MNASKSQVQATKSHIVMEENNVCSIQQLLLEVYIHFLLKQSDYKTYIFNNRQPQEFGAQGLTLYEQNGIRGIKIRRLMMNHKVCSSYT